MTRQEAIEAILAEVDWATKKFPTWPTDPIHAAAVLAEEAGELQKACLEATYEPGKTRRTFDTIPPMDLPAAGPDFVRKEAVQTGAMAIRFLMSLEKYAFTRCPQHEQERP